MVGSLTVCFVAAAATAVRSAFRRIPTIRASSNLLFLSDQEPSFRELLGRV